jgi:uncharacterized phage protein (TIGR01671 family)
MLDILNKFRIMAEMTQRQIKFRVWDNLKKEWVSNTNIWRMKTDPNGIGEIHPNAFYWKQHPEGFTYQQFTGLIDKNGKEIFEGDVLIYKPSYQESQGGQPECDIFSVSFMDGSFMFEETEFADQASSDLYEIIGNIFENPELLEKCKN